MDDLAAMARLIDALRPWHGQLVIVGGWAHRLHRFHAMATPPAYLPQQTRDADVAFSSTARLSGEIGGALERADFKEEFVGEHTPPVAHYRLGHEDEGFYAEFLTPLHGRAYKRGGVANATVARAGITAQKLRYLDLLLVSPFVVRVHKAAGVPIARPAKVRVANPVSFIAQKLLIWKRRTPGKQAQDVLYIHDTLELFGGELEKLSEIWREQIRPTLRPKTVWDMAQARRERFDVVTDRIREAVRIPADRALRAERVQAACAYGLDQIFAAG